MVGGINHDAAPDKRHSGIQTADMFAMDDIRDAIAVQQALDQSELSNVLRIHEMDHPHHGSLDRVVTSETCPSIALSSSPFYT
jgi:hypothetical protein